jgi:glutaredoxin/DNA-binding MarR family transcriptional regulator
MNSFDLRLIKALGEETRFRIVEALLMGEKCACEIPALIGRTQSNTSMHLSKLSNSGIIKSRKAGRKVLYSISDPKVCALFRAIGYSEKKLSFCCCSSKDNKVKIIKGGDGKMKTLLYSGPGCPFCVIMKKFLEKNSIKFTEIDISKDKKKEEEMQKKSGQSNIPVVDVDGNIIVGYDLKKLKQALGLK